MGHLSEVIYAQQKNLWSLTLAPSIWARALTWCPCGALFAVGALASRSRPGSTHIDFSLRDFPGPVGTAARPRSNDTGSAPCP